MARVQSVLIGLGVGLYVSISGLAWAQTPAGTAFSYQGRLTDGGAPASGLYDLRFTLFDGETGTGTIGTPVLVDDVTVASGLFTVMLDFGPAAFAGDARWLEIAVRPGASTADFTPLASRQVLTPAPHAIFSQRSQPQRDEPAQRDERYGHERDGRHQRHEQSAQRHERHGNACHERDECDE